MKNRLLPLLVISLSLLLAACGGGESSSSSDDSGTLPPDRPTGHVTGRVFAGPVVGATVRVYDFRNGAPGDLLGSDTTNSDGDYDIAVRVMDGPLLIESTGGRYNEEASGVSVNIRSGDKLLSYVNYTQGAALTAHITHYTTIAVGLAEYNVGRGVAPATALADAFTTVSSIFEFDIRTTVPLDVTNPANRTASVDDGHAYGFQLAAISEFAKHISLANNVSVHTLHTAQSLTNAAYQDIKNDGVLNGSGPGGAIALGTVPMSTTVWRHYLAVHILKAALNTRNQTSLTTTNIRPTALLLNDSTSPIFDNTALVALENDGPDVTILTPTASSYVYATVTAAASVFDDIGISRVEFLVDGNYLADAVDVNNPSTSIITSNFSDGVHALTVRATNGIGVVNEQSVNFSIDNRRYAFAAGNTGDTCQNFACIETGRLYSYRSDPGTGLLTQVGTEAQVTLGRYWAIRRVMTANPVPYVYSLWVHGDSGACAIHSHRINLDGSLSAIMSASCPQGSQTFFSTDSVQLDPKGRLIVTANGVSASNTISVLPITNGTIGSTQAYSTLASRVVQSIRFSPDGNYLYANTIPSLGGPTTSIETWRVNADTSLTHVETILVANGTGAGFFRADGRFMYTTRSGANCQSVWPCDVIMDLYTISSTTGVPTYSAGYVHTTGTTVFGWTRALGPNAQFAYMGGTSQGMVVYDADGSTGVLSNKRVALAEEAAMPVDGFPGDLTMYVTPWQFTNLGQNISSSSFRAFRVNESTGALAVVGTYTISGGMSEMFAISRASP